MPMASHFGFLPSQQLSNDIDVALAKAAANSGEALYPYRDKVVKAINDELINATLIDMVDMLPDSDRKKSLHKHAQTIQDTSGKLLNQLLGKADNKEVLDSVEFMHKSLSTDPNGQRRTGFVLPDDLASRLKAIFAAIAAGDVEGQRKALTHDMKQFADLALNNYMTEFNKTLHLGMIKRGAASVAHSVIEKVLHLVINSLIPSLSDEEVKRFAAHYDQLIYRS